MLICFLISLYTFCQALPRRGYRLVLLYKKRDCNLQVGSEGYSLFDMNRPMHTAVTLGLLFVGLGIERK